MLKKIPIDALRKGMVIEKMDRSWLEHPFLTNKKRITSDEHIEQLRRYHITEVYIDTEAGDDVQEEEAPPFPSEAVRPADPPPPSPPEAPERNLCAPLREEVPVEKEIVAARVVQKEAHTVVNDVMRDVRLGRNIESEKAGRVVNGMIDSIFRNRDALASLTRIKGYDEYTFVHSVNVAVLALTLGRHLELDREELQQLGMGALLHDAGKMRVPPHILNKPGKLTDAEFAEMKRHTIYSAEVLEKTEGISEAAKQVALHHHERFSGNGYPYGLKGEEIGRYAQIAAIADVYDAMTSDRVYARGMPAYEGIKKIFEFGKRDFNPIFAQRFIQCIGIYPVGTVVQLDSSEIGIVTSVNHEKVLRPRVLLLFRDDRRRLPDPMPVDLAEPAAPDPSRYKRSIVRPVDPRMYNIEVERYLSAVV